jgi:hypothetical protein
MDNVKTCPVCHKENVAEAVVCAFCGASLIALLPSLTTEPVPDVPFKAKPPDHIVHLTKLYSDIVVLVVLGQEHPILVKGGGKTILGRYSPGEATPSVDLTPYNANLLGVSRQHATISRADETYILEDLGSTNGTWINEEKLSPNLPHPVQSGDLVRLGQLGLYVYFDTGKTDAFSEAEFTLRKEDIEASSLTVQELSNQVVPYLAALDGVQKICDQIAERKPSDISLLLLDFDAEIVRLKIKLNYASDACFLLKTKLAPWKAKYAQQIKMNIGAATLQKPISNAQEDTDQTEESQPTFAQLKSDLIRNLIAELAPSASEGHKADWTQEITAHIDTLIFSPLQLVITN